MKKIVLLFVCCLFIIVGFSQIQVVDISGNKYSTVTIGSQVWFQQNLQTILLSDSTQIKYVEDQTTWDTITTPAYCTIAYKDMLARYGYLYNWYAVGTEKLCPQGWHVPKDSEWSIMVNYIGGELQAKALKETDTLHWKAPNLNATNSTGFAALPAGYRAKNGIFYNQNTHAFFWTASKAGTNISWFRNLGYNDNIIGSVPYSWNNGYSVRCVKN